MLCTGYNKKKNIDQVHTLRNNSSSYFKIVTDDEKRIKGLHVKN